MEKVRAHPQETQCMPNTLLRLTSRGCSARQRPTNIRQNIDRPASLFNGKWPGSPSNSIAIACVVKVCYSFPGGTASHKHANDYGAAQYVILITDLFTFIVNRFFPMIIVLFIHYNHFLSLY